MMLLLIMVSSLCLVQCVFSDGRGDGDGDGGDAAVVGGGCAGGSGVLAQANMESQRVMPNGATMGRTFVGGRGKP